MNKTHTDILNMWPSLPRLSEELNVRYNTLTKWKYRNSIPADKWVGIVESARRHDLPVTFQLLAEGKVHELDQR